MELNDYLLALPGVIGLLATAIKIVADWQKGRAEAADVITDAATDVVALLRGEIAEIKAEAKECKQRISRLEKQIREMDAVPVNGGDTA
jgi:hypothetical protein